MTGGETSDEVSLDELVPPYLHELASLLEREMPDAWQWTSSEDFAREDLEAMQLDLLRTAVRIDRESQPRIYAMADRTAERIGIGIPVTLYQLQNPAGWNASAMPIIDHAHISLAGPIASELSEQELTAVLAHELGHVALWRIDSQRQRTTMRLLDALCADAGASVAHYESDRLRRLYTEIFCDRVALQVVGDPLPAIASLLKIGTQTSDVDSESYLRQADEIFAATSRKTGEADEPVHTSGSEELTHPELYIRASSLQLWADQTDDLHSQIERKIQGKAKLDSLDLLGRSWIANLTRLTIDAMLRHRWLRTDAAIAHARLFFDDYEFTGITDSQIDALAQRVIALDDSIREYVVYTLLDFATTDRQLEDLPLVAALDLAERFEIKDMMYKLARKELRLRAKQIKDLDAQKETLLKEAQGQ